MKFIFAILGLILLSAGVYVSFDSFLNFASLELNPLALQLSLSFLAMVLGLYWILSLFVSKKTPIQLNMTEEISEFIQAEDQDDLKPTEIISDASLTQIFKLEDLKEKQPSPINQTQIFQRLELEVEPELLKPETILMPILKEDINTTALEDIPETLIEDPVEEPTTDTLKLFYDEESASTLEDEVSTHSQEARLIGIEPWGVQRILKRLKDGDEVELKMNSKHGLKSAEIFYESKSIGYLSKVDFNKIEHDLPNLIKIEISTLIQETKAVDMVMLRLIFKNITSS